MSKLSVQKARRDRELGIRRRPPFNARPISAAGRADRSASGPYATHYTATASWLYINRLAGEDRFGPVPEEYLLKNDLIAAGMCHPLQRMPAELRTGNRIWREADEAAALEGPHAISATHIVADLPPNAEAERWRWLVERYCYDNLVERGMVVSWSIHAKPDADGGWVTPPHAHLLCTARFWRPNARQRDRQKRWLANADQIRVAEDAWLELIGLKPGTPALLRAV
ncbi:MAG: MobA/MobL family protein [Sphingomonas sp.]|nr:MobA/MobL family protein [Sphingomonas sp.]OQW48253.1 MAG: hypothetical protein A4S16_00880 [Proteobacteria bacterium SG_bin6]